LLTAVQLTRVWGLVNGKYNPVVVGLWIVMVAVIALRRFLNDK
jgi:hypothetical protein